MPSDEAPRPLTRIEWERCRGVVAMSGGVPIHELKIFGVDGAKFAATLDALFEYRERTRGMEGYTPGFTGKMYFDNAGTVARELGLE